MGLGGEGRDQGRSTGREGCEEGGEQIPELTHRPVCFVVSHAADAPTAKHS
jgi:hypothetical protein